uniref:Orf113e n=1 Tax=Batis maritima TaxID=4436 RepID=A0A068BHS1_BATMA|nr:orf113e [Batis maritima]AIC83423.1 orf113e [Batis maritima]
MAPALCFLNSMKSTVKRLGFFTLSCPRDGFENVRSYILYRNPLPWTPSYQNYLWLKRQASIPLVLLCPTMTLCVLLPLVLGLLHLLHFLPNHAFILTARAVTIDENECPILPS